jgi:uncharacterized protein YdaU (DUF1376 family)
MRRPWMPFYPGDYISDTGHLSTVQHGAYLLLILHYWMKGELPDDDDQLASIVHLTRKEWLRHRLVLQAFFHDGWKHKRIDREIYRTDDLRTKRAAAGQKGGIVASINRFKRR